MQKAQDSGVSSKTLTPDCLNKQCLSIQVSYGLAGLWHTLEAFQFKEVQSPWFKCPQMTERTFAQVTQQALRRPMSYTGNKALWRKGTVRTYSSASSFLIPSQAFRRFCLTPLWLSHLPEERHQCQHRCKVDTSKLAKHPGPGACLPQSHQEWPEIPLNLIVSILPFLQLSAKGRNRKLSFLFFTFLF